MFVICVCGIHYKLLHNESDKLAFLPFQNRDELLNASTLKSNARRLLVHDSLHCVRSGSSRRRDDARMLRAERSQAARHRAMCTQRRAARDRVEIM